MRNLKKVLSIVMVLLLGITFTACDSGSSSAEDPIIIYDGLFSEMKVVHQMVKMLVEEHTDVAVEIRDEMAPVNAYNQMVDGKADLMNSYDGTLLTTYLKLDTTDVPEGMTIYEYANQVAKEEAGVQLLDKFGSENTYAIGVLPVTAEKYDLKTLSDLASASDQLVFGAEHEFYADAGSMKYVPFTEFYGMDFKENKPIDLNLKYSAIESGNIDVTIVYTTDGMNKKVGLVVLEDDQGFFPEYNTALLVRTDVLERYKEVAPNLEEVLNKLGGQFTNEIMTDLTYEVDVNNRTPEDVAREFLQAEGLI